MPANTPIFGFPYPLGTDPVSQGDNDIRALAEDVETVVAKTGLWSVTPTVSSVGGTAATVSGNAVIIGNLNTSVSVDCFTAQYDNYKVIISDLRKDTAFTRSLNMKFRTTSGDQNSSFYFFTERYWYATGPATVSSADGGSSGAASCVLAFFDTFPANATFEIFTPTFAGATMYSGTSQAYQTNTGGYIVARNIHGGYAQAEAHVGFTLSLSADAFTGGTIRVYGYNN